MIERKIIIALITNTEFLKQIQEEWSDEYLESQTAKLFSRWCWSYFKKYEKAPMRDIEMLYIKQLKKGIDSDLAIEIEEEILPGLSSEYENTTISTQNILDETRAYFVERQIVIHNETIEYHLSKNEIEKAQELVKTFKLKEHVEDEGIELSSPEIYKKLDEAFAVTDECLIEFPGALGEFWNSQLVRGGFVGILAPEKRGKTMLLLEFMMRAYKQGRKVAFFQAGDMTDLQQLVRISIYLSRKPTKEKYCGKQYIPVPDCIKNQADTCDKKIRDSYNSGIDKSEMEIRKSITYDELVQAQKDYPQHKNCYNCAEWRNNKWGTVWLQPVNIPGTLTVTEAKQRFKKFFIESGRQVKISTHANSTLTLSQMDSILDRWELQGFKPDVILLDYPDIMAGDNRLTARDRENEKWKGLRRITQQRNVLLIAPTQADANSYEKDTLGQSNFSEDKRKYAHVTAMYGLNQDAGGREKKLGLMRINSLMVREDEFITSNYVNVLQKLSMGRAFLTSFY